MADHYAAWFSRICPATVAGSEFSAGRAYEGLQIHLVGTVTSTHGPNFLAIGHWPDDTGADLATELCAAWQATERFASWRIRLEGWTEQPPWFREDHPAVLLRVRWRGGADGQIEILLAGRIGPIAGTDTGRMLRLGHDVATAVCPLLTPMAKTASLWRSEKQAAWSTARRFLASPGTRAPDTPWHAEHIATVPHVCHVCHVVYATDGRARKIVVVNDAGGPPIEIVPGHVLDIAPPDVPRPQPLVR